jgi:hypothetical protein
MVVDQIDVDDIVVVETKDNPPIPGTLTLQKPFRSPVSGCSLKPGKSISLGARGESRSARMRTIFFR